MSCSAAMTHHVIFYTRKRFGESGVKQILKGVETPYSELMDLTKRICFADYRQISENLYLLSGEKESEFYYLGRNLVTYFQENSKLVAEFPYVSILKKLLPGDKINRESFKIFLGMASQANEAYKYKLITLQPDHVVFGIKRNPRYNSENIKFTLSDSKFIDLVCQKHRGGLEEAFKVLGFKDPKIEEIAHQGVNGSEQCSYRIQLNYTPKGSHRETSMDLLEIVTKSNIKFEHLKDLYYASQGKTYREIANEENLSESAIKYRMKKIFMAFGVSNLREAIKLFNDKGYFQIIEDKFFNKGA